MAGSDAFSAVVRGMSAHAARPNEGVDAVVLAAHAVLAAQNVVARRLAPGQLGVLSIGRIEGGHAENVIAERVVLEGTLRYFEPEVRGVLHRELGRALDVARALGGEAELELRPGYPPVMNDASATRLLAAGASAVLGTESVAEVEPMLLAEDFGLLAAEVPGAFAWLGAALRPAREHHNPRFDIDEGALVRGASTLAATALLALREIGS